ncbi:MAG: hypothetical protein LBS81_02900 [Endomicrobium sp.]|nr:hypothetical protein [Endomicrobium sp.]
MTIAKAARVGGGRRYSFIGCDPKLIVKCNNNKVFVSDGKEEK